MYLFNLVLLDLTWREVVADIPVDATALVLYAVCLLLGLLVWQGSRPKSAPTLFPAEPEVRDLNLGATPEERAKAAAEDPGASDRPPRSRLRRRGDHNGITWIIG